MSDEHYLKAITELGDTRKIVASGDIYSKNGTKLIALGFQITSKLYDRLASQDLQNSLDKSLSMDNVLNSEQILSDIQDLLQSSECLMIATIAINQTNSYQSVVQNIQLPTPLSFKLTVAKEKFPRIYRHSLLLMIVTMYLAHCDGMNLQEKVCVAMAALFHDIGLLHIDPNLLVPTHIMSTIERRHLYAHPVLAYMLLDEFKEIPKLVSNAILEHHERMDGNGYPRGIGGEKISRYGQILAVGELVTKAFDPDGHSIPWKAMDVIFKLNFRKYGEGLIGHLNIFHNDATSAHDKDHEFEYVVDRVKLISKLCFDFNNLPDAQSTGAIYEFAKSRLMSLRLSLFSAGIDPRDPEGSIQIFVDNPDCIAEFMPILDEAIWQFKSLLLDIARKWPEDTEKSEKETVNPEYAWIDQMKLILSPSVT